MERMPREPRRQREHPESDHARQEPLTWSAHRCAETIEAPLDLGPPLIGHPDRAPSLRQCRTHSLLDVHRSITFRSLARARLVWLLTVPTLIPSTDAVSASVRPS